MLVADAQEANNEYPSRDSNEENPELFIQDYKNLYIDKDKEDYIDKC